MTLPLEMLNTTLSGKFYYITSEHESHESTLILFLIST